MDTNDSPIRAALRRNRLSQVMVADGLGVSRQIVWEWCEGRTTPNGPNLAALLRYLQKYEPTIGLDDLMPAEREAVAS